MGVQVGVIEGVGEGERDAVTEGVGVCVLVGV